MTKLIIAEDPYSFDVYYRFSGRRGVHFITCEYFFDKSYSRYKTKQGFIDNVREATIKEL